MPEAVITGGARTAIGRLLGALKDFTSADLGGILVAVTSYKGVSGANWGADFYPTESNFSTPYRNIGANGSFTFAGVQADGATQYYISVPPQTTPGGVNVNAATSGLFTFGTDTGTTVNIGADSIG